MALVFIYLKIKYINLYKMFDIFMLFFIIMLYKIVMVVIIKKNNYIIK